MSSSRVLRRRGPSEQIENYGTVLGVRPAVKRSHDAKALFVAHWAAIRDAIARHQRQGVVVLAFDQQNEAIGELWLESSLDRTRAAIVGRHSHCDLVIGSEHQGSSLRQLALLVRAVDHRESRIRALDLRTGTSLVDEAGRELAAVTADAPLFLWAGDVALAILRTPEPGGWPDDAAQAFATLPERVFLDERLPHARRPPRPIRPVDEATFVRSQLGPMGVGEVLCGPEETAVGMLTVTSGTTEIRYRIGEAALERGVLLGRYERCQVGIIDAFHSLSRVHVMIVRDGDDVLAVDTASTNGVTLRHEPRKIGVLASGDELRLTDDVRARWDLLG